MKHTKGPWKRQGNLIFSQEEHGKLIAKCSTIPGMEDIANSKLIRAAPDMLEALERIRDHYGFRKDGPDFPYLHAAIAKAKGEA